MYQIYFRITLHMFLTVFQSIIRSSRLHIQQHALIRFCCLFDKCLMLYVQSNS